MVGAEPTFLLGIKSALMSYDFESLEPADAVGWSARPMAQGMVFHTPSVKELEMLTRVRRDRMDFAIVVILEPVTDAGASEAIRRGANCIVDRQSEPASIVAAILASFRGESILPTRVVRSTFGGRAVMPAHLPARDQLLLQCIASGLTTDEIAVHLSCSTRTLNRWKQALYASIGAKNQAGALALALLWGLSD